MSSNRFRSTHPIVAALAIIFLAVAIAPGTAFAKKKKGKGGGGGGGKKRVAIVAPVDAGAAAAPLVGKISKALKAHKITAVGGGPVKKAVGKEPPTSDEDWMKVAAKLKVDAVIESTMSQMGTKNKLEIVVRNGADGSAAGRESWSAKGPPKKLAGTVGAQFWKKLGSAIEGTKKGEGSALPVKDLPPEDSGGGLSSGGKSDESKDLGGEPAKSAEPEKVAVADDEGKSKGEKAEGEDEKAASGDEEDDEKKPTRKKSRGGEDGEGDGDEGDGKQLRSLEVELDLRILRRVYQYSPLSVAKPYELKFVPLFGGQASWYPIKYAGIFAKGEFTAALKSGAYPTVTRELIIGGQGRYPFSVGELHLNVAFFQHIFRILDTTATNDAPRSDLSTPNVAYTGVRIGGGGRFYLGDRMLVGADGAYRLVTNPGTAFNDIHSAGYFPKALVFVGLDVGGFFGFKIMDFLEARVAVDYRRYVFGAQTGRYTVAGISDDYVALNLGIVGVLGGK